MATVNTSGYRAIKGAPWGNQLSIEKLVYDFATDDMTAANDVKLGSFDTKQILVSSWVYVNTAFTSGGAATLQLGLTSDTNCILAAAAVATLTADSIQGNITAGEGFMSPVAATDFVVGDVATADMTAGKCTIYLQLCKI